MNKNFKKICTKLYKNKVLFLMLMPAVIFTIICSYIPMTGIVMAFKNYKFNLGVWGSPWVGMENFEYFASSGKLWQLTKNTIGYNVFFILSETIFQVAMAIIIVEMCTKKYKKFLQSVMILPYFLSWVIIGNIAYFILNYEFGILNQFLNSIGLESINVYNNPAPWKWIFLFVRIWQGSGYGMIYYLAAVNGVNQELFEAAKIDGCGLLQRIRYITIPLIMPTVSILLLLSVGKILKGNKEMFYQLVGNNSLLYEATDVIDVYVFRSLQQNVDYSVNTAIGLYQNIIGFILVITVNYIAKKLDENSALF